MPPADPSVKIEPLKPPTQPVRYTEDDLHIRQFTNVSTRRLTRKGRHRAPDTLHRAPERPAVPTRASPLAASRTSPLRLASIRPRRGPPT